MESLFVHNFKKEIKMKKIIALSILFCSCNHDCTSHIGKLYANNWLYLDGYHITDILDFNSTHVVDSNCNIIISNNKVACIKSVSNDELIITDTSRKIMGYYRKFNPSQQ
jgi:hypothetical protein